MNKAVLLFTLAGACLAGDQQRVKIASTDEFTFAPGGTIEIRGSFGEVKIEAWDKDIVDLRIVKKTQKKYEPSEEAEARRQLERVHITTTLESASRLVIETEFPSRNLFKRPLRGKSNLDLEYRVKAPRNTRLDIRHDIGEVAVAGIAGDISVTNRIGAISLKVPPGQTYSVDARARIGDVSSDFDPQVRRKMLVGASLVGDRLATHRIYARVGIGEISVRRAH